MPFAIAAMDARKRLASWFDISHLASYIVTPIVDILSTLKKGIFGEMQDVSNLVCKNLHATDVRTSNPYAQHTFDVIETVKTIE